VRPFFFASIVWLILTPFGLAAELPVASPSDEGIGRVERISSFFKAETDAKRIPGAVVMIARNGKVVYQEAFGVRDPATGAPMQKDTIFRMYSMTKPITGVAVLMLMEEGKLRLTDPISKYLPALKSPKVMVELSTRRGGELMRPSPPIVRSPSKTCCAIRLG
jgi:CubicO group peptidase (beta-lactamase class C family)